MKGVVGEMDEDISSSERSLSIFVSFPTLTFTDWRPNGDGLVAFHLVDQLIARVHRVHVATPRAEVKRILHSRLSIHEMPEGTRSKGMKALRYMFWTRKLLQELRKHEQIDIVHELNPVFTGLSLGFIGIPIPVVLGPHSSRWPVKHMHSRLRALTTRGAAYIKNMLVFLQHRSAAAVILSTPAALNNVSAPDKIMFKLFIVPPGIDTNQFTPAERVTANGPILTVLFLANMLERKGIYTLLEAFKQVHTALPDVRLRIAGDGPEFSKVKQLIDDADFVGNVELCGRVERADICSELQRCTVYCLPSFGEPFGMTALEAMSCGKPLVVTQSGGLGYMVLAGGGLKIPEGDSDRLAAALIQLLQSAPLREQMGHHNRLVVERQYAWPVVGRRLESVYYDVLGLRNTADNTCTMSSVIAEYRARQLGLLESGNSKNARATFSYQRRG